MNTLRIIAVAICLTMSLTYCAFDVVHVKQVPTQLEVSQSPKNGFQLEKEANVNLGTGFRRVLRAGTRWDFVGTTSDGDVYRSKDQILTVEASNIHEAYLVISSGKLVGFYLPVEGSFSPLGEPQVLITRELGPQQ